MVRLISRSRGVGPLNASQLIGQPVASLLELPLLPPLEFDHGGEQPPTLLRVARARRPAIGTRPLPPLGIVVPVIVQPPFDGPQRRDELLLRRQHAQERCHVAGLDQLALPSTDREQLLEQPSLLSDERGELLGR